MIVKLNIRSWQNFMEDTNLLYVTLIGVIYLTKHFVKFSFQKCIFLKAILSVETSATLENCFNTV